MASPPIFICYRRTDAGWAGRLEHELMERFGTDAVFRDRTIPPGVNWRAHIERVLDACEVMLVMIGPSWTQPSERDRVRALWGADDEVRHEIERGLQRDDVVVIPVLFDGATMPTREQLPPGLHDVRDLQAIDLTDARWDYDATRLGDHVAGFVPERKPLEPARVPVATALTMMALAVPAALSAVMVARPLPSVEQEFSSGWAQTTAERLAAYGVGRAVLWGLVAALVLGVTYYVRRSTRADAPTGIVIGLGTGAFAGALGGASFIVLSDVVGVAWELLLNGTSVAVTGFMLAGRFARLCAGVSRATMRKVALGGGFAAGALTSIAVGPVSVWLSFVLQALLLVGVLVATMFGPRRVFRRPLAQPVLSRCDFPQA